MELIPTRVDSRSEAPGANREPSRECSQEKDLPLLQDEHQPDPQHLGYEFDSVDQTGSTIIVGNHVQRIPLQDCSNMVQVEGKTPGENQAISYRGEWKRRARMQGKEEAQPDIKMHEQFSEAMPKRNRHVNDQAQEDHQPGIVSKN